ncbi:MAG: OmpA family protein [Ignavibacteriales bacterium]|nr:MAG: OmpA family protein [Ignavibacteriales bacterium]
MRKYFSVGIIVLISVLCIERLSAQSSPYIGTLNLSLNGGATIGISDYKEIKMGGTLSGAIEYFFDTRSVHIISAKLYAGGQNVYGKDYRGVLYDEKLADYFPIPEVIKSDMYLAGLGFTYGVSLNDIVLPYIGGGISFLKFSPKDGGGTVTQSNVLGMYDKTTLSWDIEAGIRFPLNEKLGLQFSGAIHFLGTDYIDDIAVGSHNDLYSSFTIGLSYSFLGHRDSDGDGLFDSDDSCPDQPEDFDGFQDYDGCPESDNDLDGIPDELDQCPNEAEDIDGFKDEDGCVDNDNDNDGIMDRLDSCPDEPEDFDGFQDDDGCADPDNDSDGILDINDKCKDEAETFNGFQDEDGCPDIAPLNEDSFSPKEILLDGESTFEVNSADIKSSAFTELDRIVNLLRAYPSAKWRIEGHMDNQNSSDYSRVLSLKRAESILNYFILKGLPSYQFEVIGMGDKFPIANNNTEFGRAKNRRIEIVKTN